ncbi:MAG: DUF3306 domain-containing protein [Pseudomonadota bacterium]
MADGFLGRWSRRKLDVKEGKPPEEPVLPASSAVPEKEISVEGKTGAGGAAAGTPGQPPASAAVDPGLHRDDGVPALPTLEDVRTLTHQGDFKPYMARGVAPEVKNAAMKKLFADPHFNVMDRLDTYIDDYSQPDPIPASMLRQMVGSKLLGLFDDEEKKDALAKAGAGDVADAPGGESVAQSYANPDIPGPETQDTVTDTASPRAALPDAPASQEHDAHTDLRLQPDDAAPAQGAGRGPQ